MNPISRWLHKRRVERELSEEMLEHLAQSIDNLRAEGYDEQDARSLARRQFGNLTLLQEESRAAWGWNTVEQLWQDVRFGCRVLKKTPAFTITAILVLSLGIGMNTAMFSTVKAVLLSALPYPEPERIVELRQTAKDGHMMDVSAPDFSDWRAQTRTIEYMATYGNNGGTVSGDFPARRVRMAPVGSGFFNVIGSDAVIGRTFSALEQKPGGTPTLLLGYELAQSIFGAPGNAIAKSVRLNGMLFTVIGVMPPGFNFPDSAQLWLPNDLFPDDTTRSAHNYRVVGRLKRGVTVRKAQADMNVVASRLARQYVDDKDEGIRVMSLYDSLVSSIRPALLVLLGAVTLVLLIACVNISNLQLVRAAARRKEMGMRGALGAARERLVRQLLTESVLLAAAGGLLGLALAEFGIRTLRVAAAAYIPRIENLDLDSGALWFTVGVSLLVGILFGVLPSIKGSKVDVNDTLKQGTGKGTAVGDKLWSRVLVLGQVALAMILLSGAGLLLKSYWKLAHVETGLASGGVYTADLTWPIAADGNSVDGAYVRQTGSQILEQISRLPEVHATALVNGLPFEGAPDGGFEMQGRPLPADPHLYPYADYRLITPEYFKTFGVPILSGRGFTAGDERAPQQVAIVNQSFGKRFFPSGEPLGKRIRFLGFDRKPQWLTIVGIVPDLRVSGLNRPPEPEVYANYFQHADTRLYATLVVRGPSSLQPQIEKLVTSLNRSTAVHFESMDALISGTIARERFQTTLLVTFAACALLLAVIGIYGLLANSVARRTSEIGLRMALGSTRQAVVRLILREGSLLVVAGIALGLIGSLLTTRVLKSMLYQLETTDPSTLLVVVISFAAAALVGCYLPAFRASQVDPSEALRAE